MIKKKISYSKKCVTDLLSALQKNAITGNVGNLKFSSTTTTTTTTEDKSDDDEEEESLQQNHHDVALEKLVIEIQRNSISSALSEMLGQVKKLIESRNYLRTSKWEAVGPIIESMLNKSFKRKRYSVKYDLQSNIM